MKVFAHAFHRLAAPQKTKWIYSVFTLFWSECQEVYSEAHGGRPDFPAGTHPGVASTWRKRALKWHRYGGSLAISSPRISSFRVHFQDHFHHIVGVALREDAPRDGQTQQFVLGLIAEYHRPDLDRPYARVPVQLHGQRLPRKLRARNMLVDFMCL
jgi:hypothetical protein